MYSAYHAYGGSHDGRTSIANTVAISDLLLAVVTVLIMYAPSTSWTGLSGYQTTLIRTALSFLCLAVAGWKLLILGKRITKLGLLVVAYAALVIFQGVYAGISPGSAILAGIVYIACFAVPYCIVCRYGFNVLITLFFYIFLAIALVMDIFAVVTGGQGTLVRENEYIYSSSYLLGNKFVLSYTNMAVLGLYMCRRHRPWQILTVGVVGIFFCALTQCSTGVVGIVLMLILELVLTHTKKMLRGRWTVPVLLIAMAFIAVCATWIMTLPVVQQITVGLMGETPDFSGRLPIYAQIPGWLMQKPIFGYGSAAAANLLVLTYNGAADCQEGLMQIFLSNGLFGGAIFLAICVVALRHVQGTPLNRLGIYIYVLAMSFISLVEINLGSFFFLGLAIAWLASCAEQQGAQER
jgi:O-antigen ligase